MQEIRIGTLVEFEKAANVIPQVLPHGFESFSLTFWEPVGEVDLVGTAKKLKETLAERDAIILALSIYGNPLVNADSLAAWEKLIDNAHLFDVDLVTGFTGRLTNRPIDESIPRFKEVFGEMEMTGQVRALNYLKQCRGGDFVPNPV